MKQVIAAIIAVMVTSVAFAADVVVVKPAPVYHKHHVVHHRHHMMHHKHHMMKHKEVVVVKPVK